MQLLRNIEKEKNKKKKCFKNNNRKIYNQKERERDREIKNQNQNEHAKKNRKKKKIMWVEELLNILREMRKKFSWENGNKDFTEINMQYQKNNNET